MSEMLRAEVRPNQQRSKNTIAGLWVMLALIILNCLADIYQFGILKAAETGNDVSQIALDKNELLQQAAGTIYLLAFIVTGIFFIFWFRRAYYNMGQLYPGLVYNDQWAVWGWIIPVISFFRPYQIMDELYKNANHLLRKYYGESRILDKKWIGWWWGLWIVTLIAEQVNFRLSAKAITLESLEQVTLMSIGLIIIKLPLVWLAIKVVRDYSSIEPLLKQKEEHPSDTGNLFSDAEYPQHVNSD